MVEIEITTKTEGKGETMKLKQRGIATIVCICLLAGVTGCGTAVSESGIVSENLMEGVEPREDGVTTGNNEHGEQTGGAENSGEENSEAGNPGGELATEATHVIADFGVSLLQNTIKNEAADKNVLVSPLSVITALAMTANGAEGETKAQMEAVLGENLNAYLREYKQNLPQGEYNKLHIANAIWFKDAEYLQVKDSFLQTNADYYGAAAYKAPFDDTTLQDINNWVETNTDGMIKNILSRIDKDAVMYLVNALSFDAEWSSIYYETQIRDGEFTKEDGIVQKIELMYSSEYQYLEDELATGVIKYYKGRKYAFVALLPKEGVTVAEYVESLTGEHLAELLANPQDIKVYTRIPKFETEYDVNLNDILVQMGMEDAFDEDRADFSAMADLPVDRNLYINNVIHKTFISVDEKGTKAGAATVVEMADTTSAVMDPEEPKRVYLDRPFVYLLIDCENNEPIFIGTMMDMEK